MNIMNISMNIRHEIKENNVVLIYVPYKENISVTGQKPPTKKPPGLKPPDNKPPSIIEEIIVKYAVDAKLF